MFIDLLFVGIISNISEHFFDEAFVEQKRIGAAVGDFILLFIPAWRIWQALQSFLNSYYMDDIPQRALILWVLILGLIWGNNAPYFLNNIDAQNVQGSNFLVGAYLFAGASLKAAEAFYSIWIPW